MEIVDAVDLYHQYVLVEKGLSPQTWISYLEDLEQFFAYFSNKKDTSDLAETDLYEFLKYELAIGKTVSTAVRRLSSTRGFYLFLKKEGYYTCNIPEIETPKRPKRLPNCLSEEEIDRLLETPDLKTPSGIRDRAMLETMYDKWGLFPALSAGWRVSGEDFMKDYTWVDDLKVRLGFGVTGNDLGSDLRSVELLSNGGTFWYNGAYVYTYTVSQNVNPDIRWEKKYEYNLGVDYSLLKDRLYGSLDLYFRHTTDLLWDYEVPTPPYQYTTLLANAGKMDSYGAELSLSYVAIQKEGFTWTTTPTLSFNRNKITSLSDPSLGFNYTETTSGGVGENGIMNTNTQILVEGEPVGTFYGYKFFGINPSSGLWTYLMPDQGDGVTRYCDESTAVEGDRQVLGSAQPIFTFGWNNSVRYGNWDATLFVRGVVGNKILNVTRWAPLIFSGGLRLSSGLRLPDRQNFCGRLRSADRGRQVAPALPARLCTLPDMRPSAPASLRPDCLSSSFAPRAIPLANRRVSIWQVQDIFP